MEIQDTFSICLTSLVQKFLSSITRSQILVETGHWLRISLALQLPRQVNVGHPFGESSWDIIGLANTAFPSMGIDYDLYVGEKRYSRGHKTAANAKYQIEWDNVHLISNSDDFRTIVKKIPSDRTMVAMPNGTYKIISEKVTKLSVSKESLLETTQDHIDLPLGPLILVVNSVSRSKTNNLPWNTLLYWKWTFERGEEPTEVVGNGGYSTVSGWKAYARWMQSYLFDNSKAINPFIQNLPYLLLDRKKTALEYWNHLAETLEIEMSAAIASKFSHIAADSIPLIKDLIDAYSRDADHRTIREKVAACYFNDQRTLEVFNLCKKHYNDILHRKKPW